MTEPVSTALYCKNHPDRETGLRCHRCDQPICYQCAIKTPVGQICPQCRKAAQAKYYNGTSIDVPVGAVIAVVLGAVFGALAFLFIWRLGLWIGVLIALFAGPAAGGLVAESIRGVLHRRRAMGMKIAAAGAFLIGVVLVVVLFVGLGNVLRLGLAGLPAVAFVAFAASTIYARLL